MSRRLNRLWLLPAMLLASQSWALGLGDIRLNSALNQPLRAEIELLAATPEDLKNLTVQLASAETFDRYDLDRPLFLSRLQFRLVTSGSEDGNLVIITSTEPVADPFITFLVEAVWSRGRLLREYTLLLDPPTFAPPPETQTTQAVTAPVQATQTDSGQIQRAAPQQAAPAAPPPAEQASSQIAPSASSTAVDDTSAVVDGTSLTPGEPSFDRAPVGGVLVIQRGDTLWSIAQRERRDSGLTMSQMMLAIYEANPDAFGGNINMMSAGAYLRIPSADDVFRIGRAAALAEVQRQHVAWGSGTTDAGPQLQPTLTLVRPDDDVTLFDDDASQAAIDDTATDFDNPVEARISEIDALLIDHQDALIEIGDNELAALRAELAGLRGEDPPEPLPLDDIASDDTIGGDDLAATDTDPIAVDDAVPAVDDVADDTIPVVEDTTPAPRVVAARPQQDSLVDTLLGYVNSIWGIIGGALLIAIALLVWFARRSGRGDDEDSSGAWETLDQDDIGVESLASTADLRPPLGEDDTAILVAEQELSSEPDDSLVLLDTLEVSAPEAEPEQPIEPTYVETTAFEEMPVEAVPEPSVEDTFSSETAINLDQSDPVAEADFHMAYGLYDQAADLINGALTVDPDREDYLAKLCEIYFVWGNRDAFVDAAGRMRAVVSGDSNADWDKIVIMGQQIAADHELFSGVSAGAVIREVDLEFDGDMDEAGVLDINLEGSGVADIMDIGADTGQFPIAEATEKIEFDLGEEYADIEASVTQEMPQNPVEGPTVEMPVRDAALEVPATESSESVDSPTIEQQFATTLVDATSELAVAPVLGPNDAPASASLDDFDGLQDDEATDAVTEIDLDDLDLDFDGLPQLEIAAADDTAADQIGDFEPTKESPALKEDNSLGLDSGLLDATGHTQILDQDIAVELATGVGTSLSDDDDTMLASPLDETGETPSLAGSTDMDLDLDNLTAALEVSEAEETIINQAGDDATVEQPLIKQDDVGALATDADDGLDQMIEPGSLSGGLNDARTMTEVGTKLDLARAYVDMGDPSGARSILEEVLDEGDASQRQQAQQLLESLPS